MPPPKQVQEVQRPAARRKPGRPFKKQLVPTPEQFSAIEEHVTPIVAPMSVAPPSIPFRSFKIALGVFRDQHSIPVKPERSIWSSKLYNTNLHDVLDAYRFLGLVDEAFAPTAEFAVLTSAYETNSWPAALRRMLEQSYAPLLACKISTLTAGGLLRAFRVTYQTPNETTRKCCNFFIHAAREAAFDTAPFLLTNSRSKSLDERLEAHGGVEPARSSNDVSQTKSHDAINALLMKLPSYDANWSDDVKRLWFGAYNELVLRLKN